MYQLTNGNVIKRLSDGAMIPADEGNADYREYLAWVGQGNAPSAYVAPPVDDSPRRLGDLQHTGELLGFHGSAPTPKPVLTNITLETVVDALVRKGIIEDGTS